MKRASFHCFLSAGVVALLVFGNGSEAMDDSVCAGRQNGNMMNPSNCSTYINCFLELKFIMPCPISLHFSEATGQCDYPEMANCHAIKTATKEEMMENSRAAWDQQMLWRCYQIEKECAERPREEYLVENPKNCSKFFKCDHGQLKPFDCPDGLHFNKEISVCDWPQNAKCCEKEEQACPEPASTEYVTEAATTEYVTEAATTEMVTEQQMTTEMLPETTPTMEPPEPATRPVTTERTTERATTRATTTEKATEATTRATTTEKATTRATTTEKATEATTRATTTEKATTRATTTEKATEATTRATTTEKATQKPTVATTEKTTEAEPMTTAMPEMDPTSRPPEMISQTTMRPETCERTEPTKTNTSDKKVTNTTSTDSNGKSWTRSVIEECTCTCSKYTEKCPTSSSMDSDKGSCSNNEPMTTAAPQTTTTKRPSTTRVTTTRATTTTKATTTTERHAHHGNASCTEHATPSTYTLTWSPIPSKATSANFCTGKKCGVYDFEDPNDTKKGHFCVAEKSLPFTCAGNQRFDERTNLCVGDLFRMFMKNYNQAIIGPEVK